MSRTHLAKFDGSNKTMCGKDQDKVITYGLENFKKESKTWRCASCVSVLRARHPAIVAEQAPELAK